MRSGQCYEFGPFRLDGRALFCDGRRVALTPKVVEILLALVEADGRIVSKDELMQRVWPNTFVEETSLTSNISVLRKTLCVEGGGRSYVQTVPKHGYRFVAPVALSDDAVLREIPPPPPPSQHWRQAALLLTLACRLALSLS